MIKINLLPDIYIVEERTSPTKLLVIASSILLILCSFIFFSIIRFHMLESEQQKLIQVQNAIKNLAKSVKQHDNIAGLIKKFEVRDKAVEEVKHRRAKFSKKLSQFAAIIYNNNHPVWLNNLSITTVRMKKKKKKGKTDVLALYRWSFSCICISETLHKATAFYEDIKNNASFAKDFVQIEVPMFDLTSVGDEYKKKDGWKFNINMLMNIKKPKK